MPEEKCELDSHLEIFERRLINHNSGSISLHEDVFLSSLSSVLQVELILEARASSALHRDTEPTLEDGCGVKNVRRIEWKFLSSSLQPYLVPGHFLQSLHSSVREEEAPLTGAGRTELTERESRHRGQSPTQQARHTQHTLLELVTEWCFVL